MTEVLNFPEGRVPLSDTKEDPDERERVRGWINSVSEYIVRSVEGQVPLDELRLRLVGYLPSQRILDEGSPIAPDKLSSPEFARGLLLANRRGQLKISFAHPATVTRVTMTK